MNANANTLTYPIIAHFRHLFFLERVAHFANLPGESTHAGAQRTQTYCLMPRKWLIPIVLSGSDRDPGVFLFKTSCLTERGKEDGTDDIILTPYWSL